MEKHRYTLRWGGLGFGALLGIGGLLLAGCGGSSPSDNTTSTTAQTAQTAPAAGPPGMPPGMMGYPGMGGYPGMPGAGQTASAAPTSAPTKPLGPAPKGPYRQDPFEITWKQIPPPPNVFEEVQPLRVASADIITPPAQPIHIREVADRRVSGIMSGDGVFAIIEQNGESEVVKPGSLTSDGYRVVSINSDSVKLEKKEGNIIRTQTVELTDEPTGQRAAFGGYNQGGYPGYGGPGMGGGRLRPGIGPGGAGGAGGGAGGAD